MGHLEHGVSAARSQVLAQNGLHDVVGHVQRPHVAHRLVDNSREVTETVAELQGIQLYEVVVKASSVGPRLYQVPGIGLRTVVAGEVRG